MNTRASRAVPIYIFSASSFFRAKWHKFCFLCAPLKTRHREKCFDLGTNRHRKKSLVRTVQTFPLATRSTRLPRARTFYNPPHVASLALLSFSVPSPRRPFSTLPLLRAAPRSAFAPLCLIRSLRPIRAIRVQKKIIRVQKKFLSDSCANAPSKLSPALCKPHAKASAIPLKSRKNAVFLKFFESKSCTVQKVAVLLHSLTEKTGVPVSSERQQKFFEKIP